MYTKIKGTLDLFNKDILIINYIINIIKKKLKLYGYTQINTPSIENYNIITKLLNYNLNKKQIFFIKNKKNNFLIFDLTTPLIRFIINNYNNIIFPFKRYQIQKVWRGENPQRNRYREFIQFDVDIVTLKNDSQNILVIELILLSNKIFKKLNLKCILFINNIKILYGLCKLLKIKNKKEFIIILDKINKIGVKKVIKILIKKKIIFNIYLKKIKKILNIKINNNNLVYLYKIFKKKNIKIGLKGIKYINNLLKIIKNLKLNLIKVKFNFTLSRGFNYYNNIIFEIFYSNNYRTRTSLLGGGEYFIKFNNKKLYFIGFSFGIYRIYNILKEKKIKLLNKKNKILFINLKNKNLYLLFKYYKILTNNNIITIIYPYYDKIKKQIKYAIKNKIYNLIFLGNIEIKKKIIKLKNLKEKKIYIFNNIYDLIFFFKKKL